MCVIGQFVREVPLGEEVIAFRAWRRLGHQLRPMSFSVSTWQQGLVCHADEAPTTDNSNGLWAYNLRKNVSRQYPRRGNSPIVYGRVLLFGKVLEYTYGYRAQKAVILEVYPTPAEKRALKARRRKARGRK